jgi:multiple antibiotic resistance protein
MMTIFSAAITLSFVMDPLGNVPFFLSVLKSVPNKKRQWIIFRETFIAYLILLVFLFFGQYILEGMHISDAALNMSGGIILFLISIRMIFPDTHKERTKELADPFIVPLAIPLIAGPSTMTMVMLIGNQDPLHMWRWFVALSIAWFVTTSILVFADVFRKYLGERGLTAMERLMGMILTTMAVQMFLNGIQQLLHH